VPAAICDLTGQWQFKQYPLSARRMRDLDSSDWHHSHVPASIFTSLIEAGRIDSTDLASNPEKFTWVSEKPWIYCKTFDAPPDLLNCDRIALLFEGLDTVANIWLNSKRIGTTNNMFIPFRFDVTDLLKPKNNSLLLKFEPAVQHARKLMSRYSSFRESDFRHPYRVYLRKAQYQFGWDFCPVLPGCGIWRPVRLEGIKKARFADVHIQTIECNHQYADVKVGLTLDTPAPQQFHCRLNITNHKSTIEHNLKFATGEVSQTTVIRINNPCLWWPAGYGPQHLYQLELTLLSSDQPIDRLHKSFGIRTLELHRTEDHNHTAFRFVVNGRPIYVKGANWVPASMFPGSVTSQQYSRLLNTAAKANINMLRIWAGGYYETEDFYNLCDRLGILLWQDFMFACGYYPDRQWFLRQIQHEAATIVKQLRNHPCLALWCGNNEIDWMHQTGKLGKSKKFYGKTIYHQLLPQLVDQLDGQSPYIPTTPLPEKKRRHQPAFLTTHQWEVWSDHQPIRQYRCPGEKIPPFVTEFGLQSLPDTQTLKTFCTAEKLRIGTQDLEKHNYQADGNNRIYRYVGELFGSAGNLNDLVYLSQLTQARAVKTYVEHLRSHNQKNTGVLFWQLNDTAGAISWSAIDYTGRPKAICYYARRFYAKRIVAAVPEFDGNHTASADKLKSLAAVVINDADQPLNATLTCRLIDLFARTLDQVTFPVTVAPFSHSVLLKLPRAIVCPAEADKSALHLQLNYGGRKIAENLFFYLPDKYIDWPRPSITTHLARDSEKTWKLKLTTNALAKDVEIQTGEQIHLTNNFIDLLPPNQYHVQLHPAHTSYAPSPTVRLRSLNTIFLD